LVTPFALELDGCYDQDGEDYPLTYTFEIKWQNIIYGLGSSQDSTLTTSLFPGSNIIMAVCCDQLTGCQTYTDTVQVISFFRARELQSESLMDIYIANTLDQDKIPSVISMIAASSTIDIDLFD
jgi:hypothetical protein